MKNTYVIILILLCVSCITLPPVPEEHYKSGLVDFCLMIAEHPDSLRELKTKYSKYYNKNYLLSYYYDSICIENKIIDIDTFFTRQKDDIEISNIDINKNYINSGYNPYKVKYVFNEKNLIGIHFQKYEARRTIYFIFIRPENSTDCYLFDIRCGKIPKEGFKQYYWWDLWF